MHVAPISSSALRDPTKSERRHAGLKQSAWSSVVVTCGVGALVGSDDGTGVGCGETDGCGDGIDDGTAVGAGKGTCDGGSVGRDVGALVGTLDGASVGRDDGDGYTISFKHM